jgi:7,8-dihydropterin-6-yl-methyl-4-(beta-D-ribofuranosyl)aminobenzene 5'-phosphate synthase
MNQDYMTSLNPVDKVEIHVLIDNVTDSHSTIHGHAESEFSYLERHGMQELSGDRICCACHGYSCLVTAHSGALRHTVLFDSGPEESAFERNSRRLGVDLGAVESIVLSHGHWDHAGGMLKALDLIQQRNGGRKIPYYAHPGMFRTRGRRLPNGRVLASKDVPGIETLTARGAMVINTAQPQMFLDNMFYVSGEVPRVTSFEIGFPGHLQKTEDGRDWEPDPWIMDERFLAVNVTGLGLTVLTACSHAGVINVLQHARDCFPGVELYAVMGGFHLAGANENVIPQTVEAIQAFNLRVIAAGHCTGWRAVNAMTNLLGDKVMSPSAVGKRYTFSRISANGPVEDLRHHFTIADVGGR